MSGELGKLKAPPGANRPPRIKGRGISAGLGKTAGRGTKGQKARKSGQVRLGFEGGQMPMQRRIPKRGFVSHFQNDWAEVRLSDLNRFDAGQLVDENALRGLGLVKGPHDGVKILANGDVTKAVTVKVNRITKAAQEKITAAGGKVELIPDRPKWERPDTREKRRAAKQKRA